MTAQPHFLGSMTLKALLEDPKLQNAPLRVQPSDHIKVKSEGGKDVSDIPYNYSQSAFLGGNLWDNKSYGGVDFNLEYMDLDAFLSENGLEGEEDQEQAPVTPKQAQNPAPVSQNSPRQFINTPAPVSAPKPVQFRPQSSPSPSQFQEVKQQPSVSLSASPSHSNSSTSPPVSPFRVEFQVSEQDLALSSIPDYADGYRPKWNTYGEGDENGQEDFDPRRKQFSEEELKPQPIIKKSKKVFVPEDLKDDKYWARRHKNNYAAKRSRDARRVKENQIAMRACFLEKENGCLRDELLRVKKENGKLRTKVEKYEGPSQSPPHPSYEPSVIDKAALEKLYASALGPDMDMDLLEEETSSPGNISSLAFT